MEVKRLDSLRNKYWNIYQSEINGEVFIWRELSRAEYTKITRYYADDYEREEAVCRTCVLEPKDYPWDECDAGIPTILSQQIRDESGFGDGANGKIEAMMAAFSQEMTSFQNQISCIITEAFPLLNVEEVENWPLEKTLWYYSRALYILNGLRGYNIQSQETQQPGPDMSDFSELAQEKAFMEGKLFK